MTFSQMVNELKVQGKRICGICNGEGVVDSGGYYPWGEWIFVKCGACDGTGIDESANEDKQP